MDDDLREFNQASAEHAKTRTMEALARDGETIRAARSAPYAVPAELDTWVDSDGEVAGLWTFGDALDETKLMG